MDTRDDHLETGDRELDAYAAALESGDTPLLGHLVLYSVFDGQVTREDLKRWFLELNLNLAFLPPELRAVDAFEKVTGPDGVRVAYPLDEPHPTCRGRGRGSPRGRQATLMIRHVRRDDSRIIRHIVREVRDEDNTTLSYDSKLGECVFHRDTTHNSDHGAGSLQVAPDNAAITKLPESDQRRVQSMLTDITAAYRQRCAYLTGDKLRTVIRRYVEDLGGIRVRPTGGVYFVHRRHADTLTALRALVTRFAAGSHLVRIPLPDQDEMREMVIAAFTTKAQDDLNRLARDIATAHHEGAAPATVELLYRRFAELQKSTKDHAELLSTSLDDTNSALQLVNMQLSSLLANANHDE